MRLPGGLRGRIAMAAVAAVALCGVVTAVILLAAVERDGRSAVDEDLRQRAEEILTRPGKRDFDHERRGPPPGRLGAGSGAFAQVSYRDEVIEQEGDVPVAAPGVPRDDGFATIDIDGKSWRSLTTTVGATGETRLQVLSSLEGVEERVADIRRLVVLLGLAALGLTALAAWGFTTVAVRPLGRLREGAARVSGTQDLSMRLPEDEGPDEVRSLAGTLNEMLARLQTSTEATARALDATRRFAADAGHELRTPLTALRADLDAVERNPHLTAEERDALLHDALGEQTRMVHLLEGLQALARGEAAEGLPREPVELGDVVDAAVYAARRRHPAVAYQLDAHLDEARVEGWEGGLRLLIDNLLDNAALHGRRNDGRVRVGLERMDGSVLLRVEDNGAGIPPAERERLLEPFARGQAATAPGTGLGLAIVAQQAALHGGELRLDQSSLGGLGVLVRLPAGA